MFVCMFKFVLSFFRTQKVRHFVRDAKKIKQLPLEELTKKASVNQVYIKSQVTYSYRTCGILSKLSYIKYVPKNLISYLIYELDMVRNYIMHADLRIRRCMVLY